jgi:peptide/nickel transport system permease protein
MWRYILKRCVWLIFVLVGTAIVIFTIMYFVPGDTAERLLGPEATAEQLWLLREKMGLNDSYIVQILRYLYNVFIRFDFGESSVYNAPIVIEFAKRIPRTLLLGCSCILLNSLIGIPIGIMAALHQNKWQDTLSMVLALTFVSMPSFWLALELILIFAVKLRWLPAFGIGGVQHYILPVFAASMTGVAANSRQMRSSMLEIIRSDLIVTARAKGVKAGNVLRKHMLPNALIPVITGLGTGLGRSIAGSIVIETLFTIPGIGMYLMTGINMRDYPVVEGSVIIISFFAAVVMLLVDIVYATVDPRIKAQYSGQLRRVTK